MTDDTHETIFRSVHEKLFRFFIHEITSQIMNIVYPTLILFKRQHQSFRYFIFHCVTIVLLSCIQYIYLPCGMYIVFQKM